MENNGYTEKTRKVHFFVHLFNNVKPQQIQTSTTPTSEARPKRKEKNKTNVQNLENTLRIPT